MRISLNEVHFFGFHGMYAEEKKIGNTFVVDLYVDFVPAKEIVKSISDTIDYVTLFEIVKARMAVPTPLLETIVTELADQIITDFKMVTHVFVKITKQKVAIKTLEGNMSVSVLKSR